ncbi:TetR/AcrR family transcriptional regulator C-terminal domain-containing protein [Streptomyces sp. NPDC006235]|uniref:TetR/AcrR family transcriptional regulator C-terminal domain-containing protein n=1 Tax=Streptomyces sp. NPDC006235 TaxID=3156736 RepID=UPI0033AF55DB
MAQRGQDPTLVRSENTGPPANVGTTGQAAPGRQHLRVFFEHFRELPEEVRDEISGKRDRYLQMLVDVLERGAAEGEFRVADPRLTALAVLGMCNWTYQWFRPGGKRDAADVARYFYGTLLGGIGAGERS